MNKPAVQEPPTDRKKLGFYRGMLWLFAAITLTSLAAIAFLIDQVRRGIPFRFSVTMSLAALIAFIAPMVMIATIRRFTSFKSTAGAYWIYCAMCLGAASGFTVLAFR